MNAKFKWMFGAMCASICWLCLSNGAFAQTLPDGPGKAELLQFCTGCHSINTATTPGQTADQWRATVQTMVNRGAGGTDDQLNAIVAYLSKNFGPDTPAPAATPQPAAPSSPNPPSSTPAAPSSANPPAPSSASANPVVWSRSELQNLKRFLAESGSLKYPPAQRQESH